MTSAQPPHRLPYGVPPPGFRLPEDTHVGAVSLQVSSLERSIEYYTRVIGLHVRSQDNDTASLAQIDDDTALVRLRAAAGVTPSPKRGRYGLYHFAILLPDRPALGRFMTHLSGLDIRVGMADHLVSEALYLWDPDGLGIEVYADRPRTAWQHDGPQLRMATDPLDAAGLMNAGGSASWTGLPRGTTMGHVHLHVGDLAEGERFYHLALGFDKTAWSYPGALFMSAGGYHHHLGTNTWAPGPSAAPDQARLLEWELVVGAAALAPAAQSLREGGYDVEETATHIAAADPWGTSVTIVGL